MGTETANIPQSSKSRTGLLKGKKSGRSVKNILKSKKSPDMISKKEQEEKLKAALDEQMKNFKKSIMSFMTSSGTLDLSNLGQSDHSIIKNQDS